RLVGYGFFFQAEDGIRDFHVTGVQTCALPISRGTDKRSAQSGARSPGWWRACPQDSGRLPWRAPVGAATRTCPKTRWCVGAAQRSEERRVGKECRSWAEAE